MTTRALLPSLALALVLMALTGCGDRTPDDGSRGASPAAAATPSTATEIPDDFPLASGMADPADALPTSRTGTGLRDLSICGTSPLRGLGLRDRMIADNSGGEAAHTRELVLLGSPEEALEVARAFADLALGCDESEAQGEVDMTTATEVRASSYGPAPAATLLQTYEFGGEPGPGTTIIEVVPAGSALLVSSIYGEWAAADLESAVAETAAPVADTVAAMAIFGDVPEPTAPPTSLPGTGTIPDDFPLDVVMVEDGGDFTRSDPSRSGEDISEVVMCAEEVWPPPGAEEGLVTHVEGPEYADSRQLLVFADTDTAAALAAMAPVRRAYDDCRADGNQVWTPLEEDTGWDSVTMGLSYDDGLGSSVFQLTRVGSAVLLVTTYGEGSLQSLPAQAADVTAVTTEIAPAMCAFTAAGC